MKKFFTLFALLLLAAGTAATQAQGVTEGLYQVVNKSDGKVLGLDAWNMATIEGTVTEAGCDITVSGDGFHVGLPGQTASGQHHLHIGSGGNFSNGDPTVTYFYEVEDPDAEQITAKAVTSIKIGASYLLVGNRTDGDYALSGTVTNAGSATNQRLAGVGVTTSSGEITMERDASIIWKVCHLGTVEATEGLTSGTYLFRNAADGQYMGVDVNLAVVPFEALVSGTSCTVSSPSDGVFNIQLGGSVRYAYCGSNGRFSANTAANPLNLYEIADVDATNYTATKVTSFKEGAYYLVVGEKNGTQYALSSTLYSPGSEDQRMTSTAVTVGESGITIAADPTLVWSFKTPSVNDYDIYEGPAQEDEPGVEGTFRPVSRDAELVEGREYMIYNSAVASGNDCWGFVHQVDGSLFITAESAPATYVSGGEEKMHFYTADKNYLFKLKKNEDGSYTFTNVGSGEALGTTFTLTPWDEASAIRGGGAALRNDDGTITPNGDFPGQNVWVITEKSPADASKPNWNGDFWRQGGGQKEADEKALLLFAKGHPYAFYTVEEFEVPAAATSVTYVVVDGEGTEYDRFVQEDVEVGTVIDTYPTELEHDYVTLTVPESLTVTENADENVVYVEASWDNLPFQPSTAENPVYYLLSMPDGYYMVDDITSTVAVGGVYDDETWTTTPYEYSDLQNLEDAELAKYAFAFVGNPYTGFKVYNKAAEQYFIQTNDYTWVGTEEDAVAYELKKADDNGGFYLYNGEKVLDYNWGTLMQRTGEPGFGNTFTATPLPEPATPEYATVTYIVQDAEGTLLEVFTQDGIEVGTVITDIPAERKRLYTDYTQPDGGLTVTAGDNEYIVTATFNYPFPVTDEEDEQIVYLLVDENKSAVGGYDYPYIAEELLSDDAPEGADLTDMNNWSTYGPDYLETILLYYNLYKEYGYDDAADYYKSSYGRSEATSDLYMWEIEGNPYAGFILYSVADAAYIVVEASNNEVNTNYTEDEGVSRADLAREAQRFDIVPNEDGTYSFVTPEGMYIAEETMTRDEEYGEERVFVLTADPSQALRFNIAAMNLGTYYDLMEAYEAAQSEIEELITGVEKVETKAGNATVFDLQGRRMNGVQKGLNIVNGKKVLVK